MPAPKLLGLLVRVPPTAGAAFAAAPKGFDALGMRFKFDPPSAPTGSSSTVGFGLSQSGAQWLHARAESPQTHENPWEVAHAATHALVGITGAVPEIIEPDIEQSWFPLEDEQPWLGLDFGAKRPEGFQDQKTGPIPSVPGEFAWHLENSYSQLRKARESVTGQAVVRVAHLDTGYDPSHPVLRTVRTAPGLGRNFVDRDHPDDVVDRTTDGTFNNRGHGTGTLGILAGGPHTFKERGYDFDSAIGGAPGVTIVPLRVGNSVVQFSTGSVAEALQYVVKRCKSDATRIHVLSMSMGGVASAAWADAVNLAYDAGVVMVTAAGNNFSIGPFGGAPTRFIVYPARFKRVLAACGVMADGAPYFNLPPRTMQGNWGPKSKMQTAMAAYTPNIPWARMGAPHLVDMDGAGTSCATPQIAAAAALYIQQHFDTLFDRARYPRPWQRVEAVREALYGGAARDPRLEDRIGRGILRAAETLKQQPSVPGPRSEAPRDNASFAFLRALTGLGMVPASVDMLALEATQLAQRWPNRGESNPLDSAITDPDAANIPVAEERRYWEALAEHTLASDPLRAYARQVLKSRFTASGSGHVGRVGGGEGKGGKRGKGDGGVGGASPGQPGPQRAASPFAPPQPAHRALRCFAIDPSLANDFETAGISEITLHVPWEEGLTPGPIGEYLEVVDVDPASGCAYQPVDLNDPAILAQNGLSPSHGSPQFHQQMVYAVCSLTIQNFERALGRRALWRPAPAPGGGNENDGAAFVRRLRVYPHALRGANAFYSPTKVALLFGYFNATPTSADDHLYGGRVFTALSHDIIAHETTHALLDGMHRRYLVASNPDVHAFHEAFADIVSLFQHFTFQDILRHQIAATRGEIREQYSLLGALASEFGRATGSRTGLRNGIGRLDDNGKWKPHVRDPRELVDERRPHARGSILVGAVFDAFLRIYEQRSSDLLRLASGGTGVLRPGAIHPDLVNRLAREAARAAQHVLTMCIRALDFCPPTDITFGEYLRAIITADHDLIPDDDLHYRVAFVEAFRRRGIYPRDVHTLSVESLLWRGPEQEAYTPSDGLTAIFRDLRAEATMPVDTNDREAIFESQRKLREIITKKLRTHFSRHKGAGEDAKFLGLAIGRGRSAHRASGFDVHSARVAVRSSPDGDVSPRLFLTILQTAERDAEAGRRAGAPTSTIPFESGCTIVADLRDGKMLYCIRKGADSSTRLARQREQMAAAESDPAAVYFGIGSPSSAGEPFAALHRGGGSNHRSTDS